MLTSWRVKFWNHIRSFFYKNTTPATVQIIVHLNGRSCRRMQRNKGKIGCVWHVLWYWGNLSIPSLCLYPRYKIPWLIIYSKHLVNQGQQPQHDWGKNCRAPNFEKQTNNCFNDHQKVLENLSHHFYWLIWI